MSEVDPALHAFVVRAGLAAPGAPQRWTAMNSGVSSDVWRVETGGPVFGVKRAVERLRVAADWRAPPGRTLYEWRWFETARQIIPSAAPRVLASDEALGAFAMEWLPEADHPLWKAQLLAGQVDPATAEAVGTRLAALHAATAGRPEIAARFETDALFMALRLDPFLLTAALRQPAVAEALRAMVADTAATHLALVHGDASPKNILVGPDGPVFLDAETAWYGDPAFDLAFCLNHLLLKRLVVQDRDQALRDSFHGLADRYLAGVAWEPAEALEARAARLLPGLMLARVDGKSPADYITLDRQKDLVRAVAIPLLQAPTTELASVEERWGAALR